MVEEYAMEELKTMEDFSKELEASFRQINPGDILEGTVIGISETEITLDLGYYTDGIVRLEDITDDPAFSIKNDVEIGQSVSATVVRRDDGAGHILLSMKEAAAVLAWDKLNSMMENQENVSVKVTEVTKGGVVVYLEGIRGFIPASKLSLEYVEEGDLESYLHKTLEVRVIGVEEENKRLILSAREILKEAADAERSKKISNVEVGLVTEGIVEVLKPYGAFVNLGNGLSGLLHISQICNNRIKHPGVVLKEGQTVKVKITEIKEGKLSLSMKALEDVAAKEIEEEVFEIPETEEVTTSLGALLAGFKL